MFFFVNRSEFPKDFIEPIRLLKFLIFRK